MPRIVIESGHGENWGDLEDDMNDWIVSGDGAVRLVILIKWSKPEKSKVVSGAVQVYVPSRDGTPTRTQVEVGVTSAVLDIPEPLTEPIASLSCTPRSPYTSDPIHPSGAPRP